MTTMPTWLTEADEVVKAATDTDKLRGEIETLGITKNDLAAHLEGLKSLASASSLGGGVWFQGYTGAPELFDALKNAAKSPTQSALGTLNRTLGTFVPSARGQALEDWKSYGASRTGNVWDLAKLAETLAGVESVAPLASALQQVLLNLAPASAKLPTQAAFDLLDEAEARLEALEAALQPAAVRDFLSAVARGGASLSMLTDEVRTWLKANNAMTSFRITTGTPDVS